MHFESVLFVLTMSQVRIYKIITTNVIQYVAHILKYEKSYLN